MHNLDVSILLGKTLESIYNKEARILLFTTSDGEQYQLYHKQDCCEEVIIESIVGDLSDLHNNLVYDTIDIVLHY